MPAVPEEGLMFQEHVQVISKKHLLFWEPRQCTC